VARDARGRAVNENERAARRALLWVARILIGAVLAVLIAGALRWMLLE